MKLIQGDKRIEITIDSYEFPYDEHGFYEDNNWLNVAVEWEDEVLQEKAVSPCLLSDELEQLYQGLGNVLLGKDYEASFIEPDLTLCAKWENQELHMHVSYAKKGRSRFYIDAVITLAQLDEMISDLHAQYCRFPKRAQVRMN